MSKELGIGLLGYSIGKVHAHAWRNLSEYYYPTKLIPRLVALSGRNKGAVGFEAKKYGFEKVYQGWEKVVSDDEVEVVDNCLPVSLHPEPMVLGAKLGKSLFCEKPLARNASEAKSMLDAAEKAKVKHMAGYNYRFFPAVALARKMVKAGEIGEVRYFKGGYLTTNGGYDRPDFPIRWQHQSRTSGYGALSDLGTHVIDLGRFIVGEVSSVSGATETFVSERPAEEGSSRKVKVDVDDITIACLKFKNGALGMLDASWLTPGRMDYLNFEVYGTGGCLKWNVERANELDVSLKREGDSTAGFRTLNVAASYHPYVSHYWPNQGNVMGWEHSFINELNHFVECLAEHKPVGPDGATFLDGYRNCLVMDGIMKSDESGKWVNLPE